jgi:hypothetical protein
MRRIALIAAALVALFTTTAVWAQHPQLYAKVTACKTGPELADRYAVFSGSMPAVKGSRRMWMRFDLYIKTADSKGWRHLTVPKFGVWQKSRGGVSGFIFDKRVQGLAAPADYRAVVQFRWYGAKHNLVRHKRRTTRPCREPDPRPNLVVDHVVVGKAAADGSARYTVVVRNEGLSAAAAPFSVGLTVDGAAQPEQTVSSLAAHGHAGLTFTAPRCAAGSPVQVTTDTGAAIAESNEADNVLVRPCPGPGSPTDPAALLATLT